MLVICPECQCKASIVEKKAIPQKNVELYCQCQNLNCSTTFTAEIEIVRVHDVMQTGEISNATCC